MLIFANQFCICICWIYVTKWIERSMYLMHNLFCACICIFIFILGFDVYADRLSQVSKSESYAVASKKPYIASKEPTQVYFDHEFTRLYKSLEVQLLNSVTKGDEGNYKRSIIVATTT